MKHAKLSASGSGRWLNCPGSIKASEPFKDRSSKSAQEGTTAHMLAEMCLEPDNATIDPHLYVGDILDGAPEVIVDKEMARYIEEYINYVEAIPGERFIETKVDYSEWATGGFGTSDVIIVDTDNSTLHVIDLKYGKNVEVSPVENSQGMLYALGAYSNFYFDYEFDKIVIHIYQPRMGNIADWEISTEDLLDWADNIVRPIAEQCMTDDAPRTPGDKQCQWCPAKATCPELQAHIEKTISADFDNLDLPDVGPTTNFQNIMANKMLIVGWLKAIENHIKGQLLDGEEVQGFKLVAGKSNRQWMDADDAEKALRNRRYKVGEIFNQKLISPTQAEKLLGKKYKRIEHLVNKPEGSPTLAPESDKRPAITMDVSDDFNNLTGE